MTKSIAIRSYMLKAMARSPLHCKAVLDGIERDPSKAMERGTALHAQIFGTKRVCARPAGLKKPTAAQRNAKKSTPASVVAMAAYDEFMAENADAHILSAAEYENVSRMSDAVRRDPVASAYLVNIIEEQSILWQYLGRDARCTPDGLAKDMSFFIDLKSTKDASPERFKWQAAKLGYMHTAAFYQRAIFEKHGASPEPIIIAVEAEYPYPVTVYRITPKEIDKGDRWCRTQMERLLSCEASNQWPGYAQSVVDLELPDNDIELDWSGVDEDASETEASDDE